MALFAGLSAGGMPGGRQRDRAARAGGASGERRQKVNVWRGPQQPGTAGLAGHPLSIMTNKPLKAYGAMRDLLRIPPERSDVPRVDIERFAAGALLDDAVDPVVILEGGGLRGAVGHRLHAVVFVPDDDPVLRC